MSDLLSNVGGFAKGFGEGVWGGAKGMVQGLGSLAEGAYNIATDPNARTQAWNDAVNAAQTAEWAVQNPGQAADAVGQGATNLYNNFVTAEQQAVANGQCAEFWGNVAGQTAFAAGTVLVPGLVEGKLAGAAGELGDAASLVKAGTTLEDAAPVLGDAAEGAATAPVLPNPDALSFVPENSGVAQSPAGQAWRDYQAQTIGADTDPLTGQSNVPALQFDNPNPNGNPYVKWDGFQQLPDGTTELIDAKTAISPFSTADGPFIPQSTLDQLVNKSAALDQNPGYTGVIEVPTQQAATDTQTALDNLGITNIDVRVRPFQDPAATVPDVTAPTSPTDVTPPADATPPTSDGLTLPNTGNLIGAGVLGAGALGNALSPPTSDPTTDPSAVTTPGSQPLYSAIYGVNPDGSLTTISPPALVSPGDTSMTPPQPITPPQPVTPPITPSPVDTAPIDPTPPITPPQPIIPPITPDPVNTAPIDPISPIIPPITPSPVDTAPIDPTPPITPPTTPDPGITSDPGISADPGIDPSAFDGGGGGGMDDMAAMDASC
jgi:hypothetical protein